MKLYHFTFGAYLPSILTHGLDTGEVLLDDEWTVATECPWFTSRASWEGHSWAYDPEAPLPFRLTVDVPRDRLRNAASHYRAIGQGKRADPTELVGEYARKHAAAHWFHAGAVAPIRIKAIHAWIDPTTGQPAYEGTVGRYIAEVPRSDWVRIAAMRGTRGPGFGNFSSDLEADNNNTAEAQAA